MVDGSRFPGNVPAGVWLLVVVFGLLLGAQSVLFPTYRAPDEPAHVDMVRVVAAGGSYPRIGEQTLSWRVVATYPLVGHNEVDPGAAPPLEAAAAPPRAQRPTFDAIGAERETGRLQQMAAHPPLYYLLAGAVYRLVADRPFDQAVAALRLLSAVMVLPLPVLCYLAAARLGGGSHIPRAAAAVPLAIPQLTHIGSSVNNDNLLVLVGAALTLPLVAVARGDRSWATAGVAGVLVGLALLTKGFALTFPLWVGLAYLVGSRRAGLRPMVARGAVALVVAGAVGGWWWLRNTVVYGRLQPGLPTQPPTADFAPDPGFWLPFFLRRLAGRFWLEPNIVPDAAPPIEVVATLLLLGFIVAGVHLLRRTRLSAGDLAVLLAPAILLGVLVTLGAWRVYARTSNPLAIHGRYLYPALVGLAVVAAAGAAALLRDRTRWLPLGVLTAAAVLQGLAAIWALWQYWGTAGELSLSASVTAMLAWAPWPRAVVVVLLVGVPAGLVAAAVALRPRGAGDRIYA